MLVVLSATFMLVDLFVVIMQVTVSVAIMQLEVSAAFMQVKVSAANMQLTIFIEIMQVGVSAAIMQVAFSRVHYAHDYFCCNYAGGCFHCSPVCDSFSQQLYIPFSNWHLTDIPFHKIDQKTFNSIISSLHLTTLVNILPKLRSFVSRIYIKISQKSHAVLLFSRQTYKRWGHLGFLERGESQKRGSEGMTPLPPPPYQLCLLTFRLKSVFTTDNFFGQILPLMFFIFDMQEERT